MAPELRLASVLVGSFLLWLPALGPFLRGNLDMGAVGMRYAGALAISWATVSLLSGIIVGYRGDAEATGAEREERGDHDRRRRAEDIAAGEGPKGRTPDAEPADADGGPGA